MNKVLLIMRAILEDWLIISRSRTIQKFIQKGLGSLRDAPPRDSGIWTLIGLLESVINATERSCTVYFNATGGVCLESPDDKLARHIESCQGVTPTMRHDSLLYLWQSVVHYGAKQHIGQMNAVCSRSCGVTETAQSHSNDILYTWEIVAYNGMLLTFSSSDNDASCRVNIRAAQPSLPPPASPSTPAKPADPPP